MLAISRANRQGRLMTAAPSVSAIVDDAEWLAHRYDPGHDAFHFRRVARPARVAVPFLTYAPLGEEAAPVILRLSDSLGATGQAPAPPPFLFHSPSCLSTLSPHSSTPLSPPAGPSPPAFLN